MFDLRELLPYMDNKKIFGDFNDEPLIKLLEEVEGDKMLVCPVCGGNVFSGKLTSVTQLKGVRPSNGRIIGICQQMINTVELTCESCGATPEVKDLKQGHTCYVCGNPTKDIYYFNKQKGYFVCPSCLGHVTKDWERVGI